MRKVYRILTSDAMIPFFLFFLAYNFDLLSWKNKYYGYNCIRGSGLLLDKIRNLENCIAVSKSAKDSTLEEFLYGSKNCIVRVTPSPSIDEIFSSPIQLSTGSSKYAYSASKALILSSSIVWDMMMVVFWLARISLAYEDHIR